MKLLFHDALRPRLQEGAEGNPAGFDKQSLLLLQNPRHPSLRAKKYNEGEDKWQARVNQDWRFYFRIVGDAYIITDITAHPK